MVDGSFKYIVIGKGMIGSAVARHLAERTDGVALIGPDEPRDKAKHDGVFADHYDEGRITRILDPHIVWAKLARESIRRYRDDGRADGDFVLSRGGSACRWGRWTGLCLNMYPTLSR